MIYNALSELKLPGFRLQICHFPSLPLPLLSCLFEAIVVLSSETYSEFK